MSLPTIANGQWLDLKSGAILSIETVAQWIQQAANTNMQRLLSSMFQSYPKYGAQFYRSPSSESSLFPISFSSQDVDTMMITVGQGTGLTGDCKFIKLAYPISMQAPGAGQGLSALLSWCEINAKIQSGNTSAYIDVYLQYVNDYFDHNHAGLDVAFKNGLPIGGASDATFLIYDQLGSDSKHMSDQTYPGVVPTTSYWYPAQTSPAPLQGSSNDKNKALLLLYPQMIPNSPFPSLPSTDDPDIGVNRSVIRIGALRYFDSIWSATFPDGVISGLTSSFS